MNKGTTGTISPEDDNSTIEQTLEELEGNDNAGSQDDDASGEGDDLPDSDLLEELDSDDDSADANPDALDEC